MKKGTREYFLHKVPTNFKVNFYILLHNQLYFMVVNVELKGTIRKKSENSRNEYVKMVVATKETNEYKMIV